MAKAQSKLQAFTNLCKAKWSNSSAFQAFVCPAESTYRLIKTNLLVSEATAITWTKSRVDPCWDDWVSNVTSNVDVRTDRQTFTLLYKDKMLSVCPSVHPHLMSWAWINWGLGLCDSCVLWHEQVCFYKSVSALCWAHECLKGTAVAPFCRA